MLLSGYLTESSITGPEFYKQKEFKYTKLDQLLTSLCSLKKLDLAYADFYLEYDISNIKYRSLVEEYIKNSFSHTTLRQFPFRLEYFDQWKQAASKIPPSATSLLLMNNLDHAFVPEKKSDFVSFVEFIELQEDNAIGAITHWQEYITSPKTKKVKYSMNNNPIFWSKTSSTIGTTLIKPVFFKSWWEQDFTEGKRITRPDNPFGPKVRFNTSKLYIPSREFFRHLDGYGHVGVSSPHAGPLRPCCRFVNNEIIHTDWLSGFTTNDLADLPLSRPNFTISGAVNGKTEMQEYLINANSRFFKIYRSIELISPPSFSFFLSCFITIFAILRLKYIREAFYRRFTSFKYNLRHLLSIHYKKFCLKAKLLTKHRS
jgi:hypothetical protein